MAGASHHDNAGLWAEQQVGRLLERRGWRCLAQRWRCRFGELDLLVGKESFPQARLLMVEVKARRRCGPDGWGVRAFGPAKRRRLARSFDCWLMEHPSWASASLEVVLALVPLPPHRCVVRWIRIDELLYGGDAISSSESVISVRSGRCEHW